ncbi:hypothetical protein DEJ36_05460 [Curtobacterium sp. MCPF17_052]|nr:hypothetical protein [Curtobacterium sp. MCPF17_052]WIB13299.1 hypothetical protein DEJ36_05460 [Curtobacterium sp. MCPF17_052]
MDEFPDAVLQGAALPDELGHELRVPDGVGAQFGEQGELGALVVSSERGPDDVTDVGGADVDADEFLQRLEHPVRGALHDLREQVLLRREVRVHRALAEARGGGDGVEPRFMHALLGEDPGAGGEQALPDLGPRCPRDRRGAVLRCVRACRFGCVGHRILFRDSAGAGGAGAGGAGAGGPDRGSRRGARGDRAAC